MMSEDPDGEFPPTPGERINAQELPAAEAATAAATTMTPSALGAQNSATPQSAEPIRGGPTNSGPIATDLAAGALPATAAAANGTWSNVALGGPNAQDVIPATLSLIERIALDPTIDISRLERLLSFQERLMARQAEIDFNEAMNRCQEEIQPVARMTENTVTRSFYAKLEAVDAAIRPIYLKHGFSLSDNTVAPLVPGNIRVECRVARGGHVERFYREAPPDTLGPKGSPTKTTLHGGASTETFLRRYLRCGVFNVVFKDMDDDGIGGTIDAAQAKAIRDLMIAAGADEARFLRYMHAGSIEEIAYRDYRKATHALEEKLEKEKTATWPPPCAAS